MISFFRNLGTTISVEVTAAVAHVVAAAVTIAEMDTIALAVDSDFKDVGANVVSLIRLLVLKTFISNKNKKNNIKVSDHQFFDLLQFNIYWFPPTNN